jgi:signal transduction histidine kinase
MNAGYAFQELDKEKLLRIYQLSAQNRNWKDALDGILGYSRPFFIFDNVVVYLNEFATRRIDVVFARAMGRGRSQEADVSWGESTANRVVAEKKNILDTPLEGTTEDRLRAPHILGIPLHISRDQAGALIFIRFGGPPYEENSIELAEFIAWQFTAILRQKSLDDYEKELEKQRASAILQGDFINNITHELRSPLGFIRGYTSTLLRKDTNWDSITQHQFLEIIERETRNLTSLIDDLLDSSRLESRNVHLEMIPLDITDIIEDESRRINSIYPDRLVHLDFYPDIPIVHGDPRRLSQVFENLFDNTIKYAPEAQIHIAVRPVDNSVVINYYDTGLGIKPEFLPMIFTRFFRIPEQSRHTHGSGLGLSICRQIIELHNGSIEARSLSGKGLEFIITLPSAPAEG